MNDDKNPYASPPPSPRLRSRSVPSPLLRGLWVTTLTGTLAFISDVLVRTGGDLAEHSHIQKMISGLGLNLVAICAGVGIYGTAKYRIHYLAPGVLSATVFICWIALLIFYPPPL